MYENYFGLSSRPFAITPDPRFVYLSKKHKEALAHLLYGVKEGDGFVLLTGEVGTGKTTLCRYLLEQIPEDVEIAVILNPALTAIELLAGICDELHIVYPENNQSIKVFVDILNQHLLDNYSQGKHTLLIIDEAQNLTAAVMEQIRLLTNLETYDKKLLQIILVGQPELQPLLAQSNLRQLAQRITARYHIQPLSYKEVIAYLRYRLAIAGTEKPLFTHGAIKIIYKYTKGIPRLINILANRALLGAYAEGYDRVTDKIVYNAAHELFPKTSHKPAYPKIIILLFSLTILLGLLWQAGLQTYIPWQIKIINKNNQIEPIETKNIFNTNNLNKIAQGITSTPIDKTTLESLVEANAMLTQTNKVTKDQSIGTILHIASQEEVFAFKKLFSLWNLHYDETLNGCDYAETIHLDCIYDNKLSFDELKQLNRPVILYLKDNQGNTYPTVLSHILKSKQEGIFWFNEKAYQLSIDTILPYWQGEFILVWQKPTPFTQKILRQGNQNNTITWLRAQLSQAMQIDLGDSTYFDNNLKNQVITFQKSNNLTPDGIVGQYTLIHLQNSLNINNTPYLSSTL